MRFLLQDAFEAGKKWITSGAADNSGVATARLTKYGFAKWNNSLSPATSRDARAEGVTKAKLEKAFREGVTAGKRTTKRNPDIITPLKSLIGKTVKIVKQGGRIIGIPVSSNPKRKPARKRNIAGFHDANGIFHPIRSGTRYGSVKGKRMQWADKSEYVEGTKKKKTVKKKTARKVAKKAVKRAAPRKVAKKKKTATKKRR